MFSARPEGYKGKQSEKGFAEFFIAGDYYGVVTFEGEEDDEKGKKLIESFKEGLSGSQAHDLATFEESVSKLILSLNFPVHVSMSLGMLREDILYVKTVGDGQVYFRRDGKGEILISGDKTASGYLRTGDLAIFTTAHIEKLIGKSEDIQAFIGDATPGELLQKLSDEEYGEEEQGFVALFTQFTQDNDLVHDPVTQGEALTPNPPQELQSNVSEIPQGEPAITIPPNLSGVVQTQEVVAPSAPVTDVPRKSFLPKMYDFVRTRQFAIIASVVILAILTWSVVFGVQRRNEKKIQERIAVVTEEIDNKLNQAQEESVTDLDQSMALITESKTLVSTLKSELGDSYKSEYESLEARIKTTEDSIVRKELKDYEEFYDFALENKNAKGVKLVKDSETIAVLDKGESSIYVLDIAQKSLTEYTHKDVASAVAVGLYDENVYFVHPEKGIYKFTTQSKVNNISDEKTFKDSADMEFYNGNIYILDPGADEIHKLLVTESGFSKSKPYLGEGQNIRFTGSEDMVIDSAIYVSTKGTILKFLSGVKESFLPEFPTKNPQFDFIYTDEDLEQVYVLDVKNASVYILTKEGEYQRQIQSQAFSGAKGLFVYDQAIFVLKDAKLFRVSLD